MDREMFGKLSEAFGPSGFEEDVVRLIGRYCKHKLEVTNDAMQNVYLRMPGKPDPKKLVLQLDAHTDECGYMVQCIHDNGCLGIIMLGYMQLTNLPAQSVLIRNRRGELIKGIIMSKPVHFLTDQEMDNHHLEIEKLYVDVGATSREEVIEDFGIAIGDPVAPDVKFSYDTKHQLCFGKAFDNRAGCAIVIDVMQKLLAERADLPVEVVGAIATQEEIGLRGSVVTAQVVKPDLAIVFEGPPSDDFFYGVGQAQGRIKHGVQIRRLDKNYLSNIAFIDYAQSIANKYGITWQEAVRRGGSTDAAKISLTGQAVPVLVLGVPTRYVHTPFNFCSWADVLAASELATQVIRNLDGAALKHIFRQDILDAE